MVLFGECFSGKTYIFLTFKILQGIQSCSGKRKEFQPHLSNLKKKKNNWSPRICQKIKLGMHDIPGKHLNLRMNNTM